MGLVKRAAGMAKKIFPRKFLAKVDRRLESTNIVLSAEEFIGIALLVSIGLGVAIPLLGLILPLPLPMPILGVIAFVAVFASLSFLLPYFLAQRRAKELEDTLPDALRQMASTLRAGVGIDAAMEDISKSGYGTLSKEFNRAVVEVRRGRALEDSLIALARRSNSPLYERSFRLITEGIERGAALADVLDSVSKDAREIHAVQRERKAATTQQAMFLIVASLFAAPFISGLVLGVGEMFTTLGGAAAGTTTTLPPELGTIILLYVIIQAIISALAVGIIRYGRVIKGLMFVVPFMIGAVVVFYMGQFLAGLVI